MKTTSGAVTVAAVMIAVFLAQTKQGPKPNWPRPTPPPNVAQGPKPNIPCRACVADTGHHVGGPFDQLNYGYRYN